MSQPQATKLKIVFGSMTFGRPNTLGARVHTAEDASQILDIFQQHGHNEIDSARIYGNGTSEEMLAELEWQKRGLTVDTKLYPNAGRPMGGGEQYTHTAADVRRGLMDSLAALGCDTIDLFYLHGPDRATPLEETLGAIDALHREGRFRRFGVSNYTSWEVARICELCAARGWVRPSVYQGIYSAIHRSIEAELVPCLRHYGVALYAFQPLAGGFLTGRYQRGQSDFEPGSRFDPGIAQGALHRGRYWNEVYFDAVDIIRAAAEKHGFTLAEVALRWVEHHSMMKSELGDALILGASSIKHLEGNLVDLEKGPLPDDVVSAMESAWMKVKAVAPKYWH